MSNIERYEVQLGEYETAFSKAVDATGISQEGLFIIASHRALVERCTIDDTNKSARDYLLEIANTIERFGVSKNERQNVADTLRYLSQFSILISIPSPDM